MANYGNISLCTSAVYYTYMQFRKREVSLEIIGYINLSEFAGSQQNIVVIVPYPKNNCI